MIKNTHSSRVFLAITGVVLLGIVVASAGDVTVVSLLLYNKDGRQAIIAKYGRNRLKVQNLSPRIVGILEDPETIATGGEGRFWILGSLSTELFIISVEGEDSRHFRLRRYETLAGGYFLRGAVALTRDRLFVGHNYGATIIDADGKTVADTHDQMARVLYEGSYSGYRRLNNKADKEKIDTGDVPGYRLIPSSADGRFLGAFNKGYFGIYDLSLSPKMTFSFSSLEILAATPLIGTGWLILGKDDKRHILWTSVVDVIGGKQKPAPLQLGPYVTFNRDSEISSDVVLTRPRVWGLIHLLKDGDATFIVSWKRDGSFCGVSALKGVLRILAARGEHLFLIERSRRSLKLVERHASTLDAIRSWHFPPGNWQVRGVAFPRGAR